MTSNSTNKLLEDFVKIAQLAGVPIALTEIKVEELLAPHCSPTSLPIGKLAVYVFMYGERCLKIGKAGTKSTARNCNEQYDLNAVNTVAKSLIKNQTHFSLTGLNGSNIDNWIYQNTNRINVLFPSKFGVALLLLLESFMQCRLNPELDGFGRQSSLTNKNFIPTDHSSFSISCFFDPEPKNWGLRGDPFLWREIQRKLLDTPLPATKADFDRLIEAAFFELSGKPLSTQDDFLVEEYAHGGMSSGYICPEFWRKKAIPLLRKRYALAKYNSRAEQRK